jgi:hypothetical protein
MAPAEILCNVEAVALCNDSAIFLLLKPEQASRLLTFMTRKGSGLLQMRPIMWGVLMLMGFL